MEDLSTPTVNTTQHKVLNGGKTSTEVISLKKNSSQKRFQRRPISDGKEKSSIQRGYNLIIPLKILLCK